MGRWSYSNKTEADYLKKIEVWWLKKHGYLEGWKSGTIEWKSGWDGSKSSIGMTVSTLHEENYVRFYYTQTSPDGQKKEFDYKVHLTTSPCNYGSRRYWFVCPLVINGNHCGKRVGVLYKDGNYFGCRHCYDLTYSSKKENRGYKMYYLFRILDVERKIQKIREKMKRSFYAGKPTRNFRRLLNMRHGIKPHISTLLENEKSGKV